MGLLNALYAYRGKVVSKERLAAEACEIEIDVLGEPIGKQDQYAAACGNINHIAFNRDETVNVTPILMSEPAKRLLENRLCLYYIGGDRRSRDILGEQRKNTSGRLAVKNLKTLVALAGELRERLQAGEPDAIGDILHRGWLCKKELADHFSSYRFVILFALIAMVSLISAYMVGVQIREAQGQLKPKFVFLLLFTEPGAMFSLVQFVAFFGPLVGLILGFDAINRERNEGTLSKLLAQPIFRDAVINGKFLAGLVLIGVMMGSILAVITGLGLAVIGVVPGAEEIWRVLIYLVVSVVYIAFWLGIAILFSIVFRSTATSALAALAVWIFFSFFVTLGVGILAGVLSGSPASDPQAAQRKAEILRAAVLVSPMELYSDATAAIIDPMRKSTRATMVTGPLEAISMTRFSGPLPLAQSILIVMPYLISLIAVTTLCFALSYALFMRQEIRSL